MPKLSTKQEGNLYMAFTNYLLASVTSDIREKRLHMKMCNHSLLNAGLPIMGDLLKSFEDSIFNIEEREANGPGV